jgi:hypothetical protein
MCWHCQIDQAREARIRLAAGGTAPYQGAELAARQRAVRDCVRQRRGRRSEDDARGRRIKRAVRVRRDSACLLKLLKQWRVQRRRGLLADPAQCFGQDLSQQRSWPRRAPAGDRSPKAQILAA